MMAFDWEDCSGMSRKEVLERVDTYLSDDLNNRVVLIGKGSFTCQLSESEHVLGPKDCIKFIEHFDASLILFTQVHPNASIIHKWADAVRPVYDKDGNRILNSGRAFTTYDDLSVEPRPKKTKTI